MLSLASQPGGWSPQWGAGRGGRLGHHAESVEPARWVVSSHPNGGAGREGDWAIMLSLASQPGGWSPQWGAGRGGRLGHHARSGEPARWVVSSHPNGGVGAGRETGPSCRVWRASPVGSQ